MKHLTLALLAVLMLALPASAVAPRNMSYQGILTDTAGNPVPDGNYSLAIRLYDVAAGGAAVYTETHASVAVSKGGFNVLVGSVTPLTIAFDKPLWLSLQVNGDPELAPRVPLASSPYAMGLSLPLDGSANGSGAALAVRNSTGNALLLEGSMDVLAPGGSTPIVEVQPFSTSGGQVRVLDEANQPVIRVEPDANGTGGFFTVYRSATSGGFTVNGNDGTEEPIVTISGSARSSVFDMSQAGDPAVSLPSSAISSLECGNEPGAAEIFSNSSNQIGLGVTTIASRTISVPEDGYVMVVAGGYTEVGHIAGSDSRVIYGVNDQTGVFASSTGVAGLPSGAPSGIYRFPTPWCGAWPVTAGSHQFHLLAQRIGAGNGAVLNDPTITLLYVATAYGAVTGNGAVPDGTEGRTGGMSQAEIDAEQREAAEFDQVRVQRELDQLRARLDVMQDRLGSDPNIAAAASQE